MMNAGLHVKCEVCAVTVEAEDLGTIDNPEFEPPEDWITIEVHNTDHDDPARFHNFCSWKCAIAYATTASKGGHDEVKPGIHQAV